METKTNLVPLAEMLIVEGISASEMSDLFDELALFVSHIVVLFFQKFLTPSAIAPNMVAVFINFSLLFIPNYSFFRAFIPFLIKAFSLHSQRI